MEDVAAGVGAAAAATAAVAAPDTVGVLAIVEGNQVFLLFV